MCLPKSVALPEHIRDATIVAEGDTRIISPAAQSWDDWFDPTVVSEDFMNDREQPSDQQREPL